jgi:hypothetical protein
MKFSPIKTPAATHHYILSTQYPLTRHQAG